jgi:PAS domain S-box-containing protein
MKYRAAIAWAVGAGLILSLAGAYIVSQTRSVHDRVYRIGWQEDPPFQVQDADGAPAGFAIELVQQAARRRGIRLEWIKYPASSEEALRRNLVDLWPLFTITEERKRFLHISNPYLQHDHYLMVRADSPYRQVEDLANAAIARVDMPLNLRLLHKVLPNARQVTAPTAQRTIEEVCHSHADAALVEEFGGFAALLAGVACRNQPLRLIWISQLQTRLGVGATFEAGAVADEIRKEIAAMGRGGELPAIMTRWGYYSPQNLTTMNALLDAEQVERRLGYTAGMLALLLLVAVAAAIQIRRQRDRIRTETAEREQAERALHESERRFRDLLESAQLVAIMIDLNGGISFCNEYALAITGWSPKELCGHPAKDFLDAGYLRQLADAVGLSPSSTRPLPLLESTILTRSGERRWIQWTSTVLRDNDGRPVGFASLGEDVTELKRLRAEAAIRESEQRFQAIFQHAAVGVAQIDLDGRITLPNDRYCSIVDRTKEELIGRTVESITHAEDFGPQRAAMRLLREGEIPSFSLEKRYIRGDGKLVWTRAHHSLVRDHDNRPRHFIAVVEDITERRRTEAALRESEERFRNMADTAPVMIWLAGTDLQCTFFNRGWLTFTGRTMAQEIGDGWTTGIHPDDAPRYHQITGSAFEERRAFQMEFRLRAADGTYRWVRNDGVPRVGPQETFAGYIGSCIDINDARRAHEEAVARQKLESVGVLAGGIAHDFNNLLGSITADAEFAMQDLAAGSQAQESLVRIRSVALRAAEIVRELLAYAGKENLVFEPVDLSALVGEMLQLLKVSISKQATLNVTLPANLPAIRANAAQVRRVVMNLVTNAAEALGRNAGTVTVSTSLTRLSPGLRAGGPASLPDGEYVRLEVSDTGCGMDESILTRIFDPYFTTKLAGRGLGLSAVQGIVRHHGGSIQMTSAPGRGTQCEILLPVARESIYEAPALTEPPRQIENGDRAAGTVMIVEDEGFLRIPVSKMLRRKGYFVIEASDGTTAIDAFRKQPFAIDVVLLDMTLPVMSGPEIFQELRRIRPDVRVVLTTAYSQETVLAALGGLQAWAFIRKPYQMGELTHLLQTACEGRHCAGAR